MEEDGAFALNPEWFAYFLHLPLVLQEAQGFLAADLGVGFLVCFFMVCSLFVFPAGLPEMGWGHFITCAIGPYCCFINSWWRIASPSKVCISFSRSNLVLDSGSR